MSMQQTSQSPLKPIIELFANNPILLGSAIILFTVVGASLFSWILFKLGKKLAERTPYAFDDQIVRILRTPIYYTLLASGVGAGIQVMALSEEVTNLLLNCLQSIGVIVWTVFFIRFAHQLLSRVTSLSNKRAIIQRRTVTLFDNLAKVGIFGLGAYLIFVIWDIDMTAWLASAGIIGIAVGFAAKDTLANLFSGVFIIADAPYKIGDYVVFENGDRGKVTNIGLRSTRMLTRDDVEITIPNSIIGNSRIINQSGGPYERFRLRVKVGVAYGTDIDQVRNLLMDIAENEVLICDRPEPRVRFRLFGASSADFELLCWVSSPELYGRALDKLNEAIYKAFAENNIEIPYTKQDLYIKQLPEKGENALSPEAGLK